MQSLLPQMRYNTDDKSYFLVRRNLNTQKPDDYWFAASRFVGGLKTNEAYHSKADALLIPEMYFFF